MKRFWLPAIAMALGVLCTVSGPPLANATVTTSKLGIFKMQSPSLVRVWYRHYGYYRPYRHRYYRG